MRCVGLLSQNVFSLIPIADFLSTCSDTNVSPVLSLPSEILSRIFCLTNEPTATREGLHFGHVCQQWRDVLFNTSEFWQAILNDNYASVELEDPTFFGFLLEQSSPRPIENYELNFTSIETGPLRSHWNRVGRVSIQICGSGELTRFHCLLQSTNMPNLEMLGIEFEPINDAETDYCLSQLQLPAIPSTTLPVLRRLRSPFFCFPPVLRRVTSRDHPSLLYGEPGFDTK